MFYYQKEFVKEKVSGEIAFDVISFFHVQIQKPKRRSTTTTAFVFRAKFYYHKIVEFTVYTFLIEKFTVTRYLCI